MQQKTNNQCWGIRVAVLEGEGLSASLFGGQLLREKGFLHLYLGGSYWGRRSFCVSIWGELMREKGFLCLYLGGVIKGEGLSLSLFGGSY